ncbi:TetR/AcrR family transcriptional regulator [Streptomyces sp. NPDC006872]|uniref:TetR/AcrR family transcriptional regulator n=1 Tax=Streptomyces sp. NPDC006872 TaxID=3155720 RepID=UPI0033D34AAD
MTGRLRAPTGRYAGKTAEQRQAERRARFLDAALEMFGGAPGYRGTTVASLSEAAGLSTRQFYEEFCALEDVLAALHLQVNDWAEAAVVAGVAGAEGLPLAERATAIFRAYAANVTADPRRIRITFVEIVGVSARLEEQRLARRARWIELICREAMAAADRGEAAVRDYRLPATAFIGSVNGLLHDWTAGWVEATLEEAVDELVRQLLGILRPPGWAPEPTPTPGPGAA